MPPCLVSAWLAAALAASALALCGSAASVESPGARFGNATAATGPHRVAFLPNMERVLARASSLAQRQDGLEVVITPAAFFHGVITFGAPELLSGVASKLLRGECLRVIALGGSVTCATAGGVQNRSDHPHAVGDAWPARFGAALDAAFPCSGAGHAVANLCQGAVASDFWVERVAEWRAEEADASAAGPSPLAGADLVVCDTAHNDVEELRHREHHLDDGARIGKYNELLINLLLRPRGGGGDVAAARPAVMYVALSSRKGFETRDQAAPGGGRADGVWAHAPVTRHYGVPQVSVVDALGPFAPGSPQAAWFAEVYKADGWGHPNVLGHQLGADLLVQLLLAHVASSQLRVLPSVGEAAPPPPYVLPATMLYATDDELRMYTEGAPMHISAIEHSPARGLVRVAALSGFEPITDVPGKPPGLIATAVGAFATWLVPPATLAARAGRLQGALHVLSLKTYDRMGTVRVQVLRTAAPGCEALDFSAPFSPQELRMEIIANATVDCLRPPEQRVSEVEVDALSFNATALVAGGGCLLIHATVIDSAPPRADNKIKLMSFVLL